VNYKPKESEPESEYHKAYKECMVMAGYSPSPTCSSSGELGRRWDKLAYLMYCKGVEHTRVGRWGSLVKIGDVDKLLDDARRG
jgi:hypothetical protein